MATPAGTLDFAEDCSKGCAQVVCSLCGTATPSRKAPYLNNFRVCRRCHNGFISRRQGAYLIDFLLWYVLFVCWINLSEDLIPENILASINSAVYFALCGLFILKDGICGFSPGKWLAGLRVVDFASGRPIGFMQSVKRNLPLLIPVIGAVGIFLDLMNGRRWGDRWAGTLVIIRRHAQKLPFVRFGTVCPKCDYDLTGNVSGICPECGRAVPEHLRDLRKLEPVVMDARDLNPPNPS